MKSNRETAHVCRRALVLPNVFIVHLQILFEQVFECHRHTHYHLLTSQTPFN